MDEQDFVILGKEDLSNHNADGLLPFPDDQIARIQRWLQPTDYPSESSEYNRHLSSHLPGTGDWIRVTDEFEKWVHSLDFGCLWIKAIPGAGKSVLAASLAARLSDHDRVPVIHFFFRQIVAANRKPQGLLRDWLSQVLLRSPWLQSKLHAYLEQEREIDSVAFDELWQILVQTLSLLPRVYCVVDALDEMDADSDRFLPQLLQLGRHKPSSVKVLMTSRIIPRIEKVFKHSTVVHLSLFEQAINKDITYYVESRLNSSHMSSLPKDHPGEDQWKRLWPLPLGSTDAR